MWRVTRMHAWEHHSADHISAQQLDRELGIPSVDHLIARRQLRWAGHVSRMDFHHRLRSPGHSRVAHAILVCRGCRTRDQWVAQP